MKLTTKIIMAFVFIAVVSVCTIGFVGIATGKKTMENEAFNNLTAIRELKANQVEAYFEQTRNEVQSYSENLMVIDAINDFQNSFFKIEIKNLEEADIDSSLKAYYKNEFLSHLDSNSITTPSLAEYFPIEKQTQYLQYLYISNNAYPTGEKQLLLKSNDNSSYSAIHSKYHPVFKSYLDKIGFYDLFLIDTTGHIVYTVHKEIDFATSINDGAFKKTNLARLVQNVLESDQKGYTNLVDFDMYPPSYNEQASFIATAIYDGEKKVGVLAFQLSIDRINNIMTDNQQWSEVGLGRTGETYIVGKDLLMRNQSRFLIEDRVNYEKMLQNIGISNDTIKQIIKFNNSIGLQKVSTVGVKNAINGKTGTNMFNDYRGVQVLSSYRPLKIKDVDWVIMSEIDKDEAFLELNDSFIQMFYWTIIILIMIFVLAVYFSRKLTKPIVKLTKISKEMADGNLSIETGLVRKDEIGVLANSFDVMSKSIKQMMDELEDTNALLENKVKDRTKEVEESHNKIKSIIENANDAIITIDVNQTITQFNPAACRLFGYEVNEIIGQSLLQILPPKAKAGHHKHIDEFKSSSESSKRMDERPDVTGMKKNGEIFPIEASISKQVIGNQMFFTAFVKDITERKEMERLLAEASQRMEDELNVGKEIQLSMLPLIFPAFPDHSEFNIFAMLESAREVGGDFYDFYFIEKNKFLFSIADVSGKGVPSALFMAVCKTLIKSRANEDNSPSSIVTFVNDELSRDNKTSMFVTLFLCVIDLSTGELKYTNAGHNPPYLKRVNGEIETLGTLHGPVVGAVEDFVYKEDRLKMLANDKLILFTDGVNEAMNIKNELYSNDRIIENIKKWNKNTLEENLKGLYNSVIKFQGEAEQADDITILGFEYLEPILNEIIFSKTLTIKNQMSEIDFVNELFNEFCEQNGVPSAVYRKFNIAFDEIINNIVSYGYNDKKEHKIKIIINITEDHLVVSIEDDAIAFNPLSLASPETDASIEDREIGGLGVHMVKKLMDNVSYKRYIKKNLTTLYKKLK